MGKNILVTTLGLSWAVVPEVYSFTSPNRLDLWRDASAGVRKEIEETRSQHKLQPVDEIWIATTAGEQTGRSLACLLDWRSCLEQATGATGPALRVWRALGISDPANYEECLRMRDLIYRTVLLAAETAECGGRVYLSLAGGRKAMSADLQAAAVSFGCAALLHVVDRRSPLPEELRQAPPQLFAKPLPAAWADLFLPLVIEGSRSRDAHLFAEPVLQSRDYPLPEAPDGRPVEVEVDGSLPREILRRSRQASSLLFHYGRRIGGLPFSNFRALYLQRPETVENLTRERIGTDPAREEADLAWLARLPKVDLHCHLGGVAEPPELVEIAAAAAAEVSLARQRSPEFDAWVRRMETAVAAPDPLRALAEVRPDPRKRSTRTAFADRGVREPLAVAAALLAFQGKEDLLDRYIYGPYGDPRRFRKVGFANYEALGDLQGSGLLQCETTLRAACRLLARKAAAHRVRYLEVRCSPLNYTRAGLEGRRVVSLIVEEFQQAAECQFRLLFIGSRHRDPEQIERHVELALELLESSTSDFDRYFAGFDLAGAEDAGNVATLRRLFLPLMERCVRLTIHAGETQPADSIWKAVYQLNADRIGHGLTLVERPELMDRFLDRKIAIEMCPSSNRQILDFADNYETAEDLGGSSPPPTYPLRRYLEKGLRVTINTDNPGISRTDWTRELLQAARLTPNGLSRWEILRLLRCGFVAAFAPAPERYRLLDKVERELIESVLSESTP